VVATVHADGYLIRTGAGGPFTSPADLPGGLVDRLARTRGVRQADPFVDIPATARGPRGPVLIHLIGVRPGGLGPPALAGGRTLTGPGEALVDDLVHVHVGESFIVGTLRLRAVAVLHGYSYMAGMPIVYTDLRDAQTVAFSGRDDVSTVALVGSPAHVPAGFSVMSSADAQRDILHPLRNGVRSIDLIKMLLWVVAVVIIGAVVYLSALERRRDFAVLKAIGSSTRWLYGGLALQAGVLALVSAGLAVLLEHPIGAMMPMPLALPAGSVATLPPVALAIGLLASLSGLRLALRADPALAFGAP
jgi:putative ABC transport system permease protein